MKRCINPTHEAYKMAQVVAAERLRVLSFFVQRAADDARIRGLSHRAIDDLEERVREIRAGLFDAEYAVDTHIAAHCPVVAEEVPA